MLAVLTVSYASSLKAYLQQRAHLQDLRAQIAEREQSIAALQAEKDRWSDPAYVRQQARERFGYLMPGERSWIVLDQNGRPLDDATTLKDPAEVVKVTPTAWWETAWASMELAGDPPPPAPPPADEIRGPAKRLGPDQP
ncbi:MAG TPA: septum formation initiator family protein [Nocardioides sp.]|uniref:FtsB family cell division protein n=1 Tax=Nocardioides sp. TaxID=35761 RepID=UPI002BC44DE1|nr:septum formation initiator family protein [Nocardioides sp.]HQR28469.1 septum formation initiator family protein [Nocardioides sp.]